jgi:anion-transporting  ArsA/GET3 family ATPase
MARILTFLGKGGSGRTTLAIAAAKSLAQRGQRVLLLSESVDPTLGLLLATSVSGDTPVEIAPNLKVLQLQASKLLEQNWEELKKLEAQYVRTPFFKNVYGPELSVLPGMDQALALNALREYDASGQYDAIVFDGKGDISTLRTLGMPEVLGWYFRRFRQVFADSDLGKTVSPFIQPVASAVLNVNWSGDNFAQPMGQVNNILEQGQSALADPNRMIAYLVTTGNSLAIASARTLWGTAQQVGLTVGGVLLNQTSDINAVGDQFAPLAIHAVPNQDPGNWQPLIDALPDLTQTPAVPRPMTVNLAERKVSLFLPGFDKTQVKLSQTGPEVTIQAGDHRRNIFLPPELSGSPVTGAKFQDGYLIISF